MGTVERVHIAERLEELVRSLTGSPQKIGWDLDLLESGFVASIHLLHIVTFMEEEFEITIDPFEISPEIFESIDTMADFAHDRIRA